MFDFLQDVESATAGHIDVQHNDIAVLFSYEIKRLLRIPGFPHHFHVGLTAYDLSQPSTNNGVIIRDEDLDHWAIASKPMLVDPGSQGDAHSYASSVSRGSADCQIAAQ